MSWCRDASQVFLSFLPEANRENFDDDYDSKLSLILKVDVMDPIKKEAFKITKIMIMIMILSYH